MGRLSGKVAIVTGAGMGMGQAGAILFAKEGAKVVIADCNAEAGQSTVKTIEKSGGEAIFVQTNVSCYDDVKRMVETAVSRYGKLNILYNNAAIARMVPLIESTEEDFDTVIAINLKGIWLGMKYAIPEMMKADGGSIINVSSINADAAQRGLSIYAASKGGVISMSRIAAIEHAAHNIRVNVIKPGVIKTPMVIKQMEEYPEVFERVIRETPKGRLGEPEEVAYLALFLASDESSYITGQKFTIDGGIEADGHII